MGGEEQVLHQLLRDGGPAAFQFAGFVRLFHDLLHFTPFEAVVRVKTRVLRRHYGMLKVDGDPVERHERVALLVRLVIERRLDTPLNLYSGCGRVYVTKREQSARPCQIKQGESQERQAD